MAEQSCPNCGKPYQIGDEVCRYCGLVFPFSTVVVPPGRLLQGRYEVQELIHTGGMGYIYLAKDKRLYDRDCIIKQVRESIKSENHQKKLEEEALSMTKLANPNIAMILDHFVEGGYYFLVVEHIIGKTLGEVFKERRGQFTEKEVLEWTIIICDVVSYLHGKGVLHRDISPDNIMLTENNTLKFIDFGTSHEFRYFGSGGTVGIGKYGYTPPEQWRGKPEQRSDIFAMGATIYYLLTGFLPLSQAYVTGQAPQKEDFNPDFPPIRTRNPKISAGFEAVLQKALQLDIDKRYPSTAEFSQAVRSLEKGKKKKPAPLRDIKVRAPKPVSALKKRPVVLWVTAGILLALAGFFGISWLTGMFSPLDSGTTPITATTGETTDSLQMTPLELVSSLQFNSGQAVFDTERVIGQDDFNITINGQITCTGILAKPVTDITLVAEIIARKTSGYIEVSLNSTYTATLSSPLTVINDTAEFTLDLSLNFPEQAETGDYQVILRNKELKVNAGSWLDITAYLPREQTLGMVQYYKSVADELNFNYVDGYVYDDATGAPIADAIIDVMERLTTSTNYTYERIRASGYSDDSGYYKTQPFSGNGTYLLRVTSGNFLTQWYINASNKVQATPITFNPGQTFNINFFLIKSGSISGKIFSEYTATVTVLEPTTGTVIYTSSFNLGTYTITDLTPGDYYVKASVQNIVEYYNNSPDISTATLVKVNPGQDTPNIDFLFDLGSISGKVVADADGKPIDNLHVYASDYVTDKWMAGVNTSSDGTYKLTGLPPGTYRVRVAPWNNQLPYATEYYNNTYNYSKAQAVTVATGQDVPGIDFSLARGASISGIVVSDTDGTGIPNVTITLLEPTIGRHLASTTTNSDGTYTLSYLMPGTFKIQASPWASELSYAQEYYDNTLAYGSAKTVTLNTGQNITGIDFSLSPGGTISGTVRNADGSTPLANISVECVLIVNGVYINGYGTNTDSLGNYIIRGLPYGEYIIKAPSLSKWGTGDANYVSEHYSEKTLQSLAQSIRVAAGENPTGINFTLTTGGSVSGKVISDTTLEGVANIFVAAVDISTGEWISHAITNADGTYTIHGVLAGSIKILASPSSTGVLYIDEYYFNTTYSNGAMPVYVTVGQDTPNINFILTPTGSRSLPEAFKANSREYITKLFCFIYLSQVKKLVII